MSLNKSSLLKAVNRVVLFLVTGALLVTGITPAQANVTTPLFMNFEAADLLKTVSSTPSTGPYGGATTEIKASTNLSGNSLHFTKSTGSTVWAGVNLLLGNSTPFRYTDASKPIITLDYWSNDTAPSPVMMKVEGAGAALKTLTAQPGLNKLSFDMSTGTGWNPDAVYKIIAFFPNFGADDRTYTGPGPVANTGQIYEIDNVSINGGTPSDLYVPAAAGRDVPATLVTFEANDTLGAKVVGDSTGAKPEGSFAGAATTIEDAPAGGNGGKALKIVKAGEVYSGATILNITGNTRITNGTHKTVTFNYFSAKANSPLRVELVPYPRALGKTVTVPQGWSRVVVDFSDVAGWSASEDYLSLAIFPDFNVAPGVEALSYFVDDIAINGAVTPAIRSTPQVLVNFEDNDSSGFTLTNFDGNQTSIVTDAPADGSVGSTKALRVVFAGGQPWAGTTFLSRPAGQSLISANNFVVKANIYSPVAGKRLNLKLENVAAPAQAIEKEANTTSVVGWKTYTFDFSVGGSLAIDYNRATIFLDFLGNPKSTEPFFIDDIAFNGAKGADLGGSVVVPPFTGNANVRLVGMDDTNSFNRPADATLFSVTNPWYRVGINVRTKQVPVGSTQTLTYLVTNAADNTPLAGQKVTLTMGKDFSGSNAKVNVGNVAAVGTQNKTVTGVTDAEGRVTFSMVNTDVAVDAADFPGANLGVDFKGKKLFTQVSAWVTSQTQDSIDLIDFIFFRPQSYTEPRVATSTLLTFEAGDTRGASVVGAAAGAKIEGAFEGSVTTIEDAPAGGNGGKALKIVKSGQPWAGANVLSFASVSRITNGTHKTVTFNYFSPKADSPLRVEIGPGALGKTVKVPQGWSRVSIDYTDVAGWSANNDYTVLAIFPDFLVAPAATPLEFFVDEIAVNGATTAALQVVVPRTNPVTLVNFESNDTSGYGFVNFGGASSSIVTDAPSGGSAGSSKAAKVVSVGECWSGVTFLTKGAKESLASSANKVITANIYSPVSGQVLKLKIENPVTKAEREVDLTSVQGWNKYSFEFNNLDANVDYNMATLFFNFTCGSGAKNDSPFYFDDVAFNGAKGADLSVTVPVVVYNARLADWNATNSFDGTKIWGNPGIAQGWFDVHTGYFAKYVAAGSTFDLRYKVTNANTGANAPDGTVVTLSLGAAWSSSNAKFSAGNTVVDGATKWGGNGQEDQATVTAVVTNGFATVSLKSNDTVADASANPGHPNVNPDGLNPRFMQVKIKVDGDVVTRQDWVNIIATKPSAAPTVTSVSARNARAGQAIDIVGTNLGDALSHSVALVSPATSKASEVSTPVTVLSVSEDRTRMTVLSPELTQKGTFVVTNTGGSAGSTAFAASVATTLRPTISMPASLVREVGSTITLTGNNLASVSSVTIGEVAAQFRIVSATSIVVTVPAGVQSGSKISATNAGGTTTTSKFIYQAAVIENSTTAAKVGETVTLTGSSLKVRSIVFGGNKAAKPVTNENGLVTVVVPTGALSGPIKITTSAGTYFTKDFTVTPPTPTVSSFTPSGKKGVTVVTVRGTALRGATVTVGSTAVTLLPGANSTSLKFVIPADATSGKITVTTLGGSVESVDSLNIN